MEREKVEAILKETEALLTGHFLLTSGKHSDVYMQCAKILQYPNYSALLAKDLSMEFCDDKIEIVAGPAMGGVIVAYEIARQLGVMNMFAERENGVMTFRRGFEIPEGARVLVAEDVITTGGSVSEVIKAVTACGGIVAGVAVLVDRSGGKVDFGVKTRAAYTTEARTYEADVCPLCKDGTPAVKPGSRK